MQKEMLLDIVKQNQLTCSISFNKLTAQNAGWRLNPQAASAGFIYRHIGETIHLFGTFFGLPTEVKNTTMGQTDTGQGEDIAASHLLVEKGFDMLKNYVESTPDTAWLDAIQTPFFGTVSRVRLFSHILFHNSHHAGQIALTLSKGRVEG